MPRLGLHPSTVHAIRPSLLYFLFVCACVLACAVPMTDPTTALQALEVMDAHSSVVTVFAGHDHSGGYWKRNGVHHLTFPSPLNAPSDRPLAHAIVDVHSDKLVVHGYGIVCDVAPKLFTEPGQSGQKYSAAVLDCPPRSDLGAVLPPPADSATAEA